MTKRTWIIIPAVLVLGLMLSACGSNKLASDLTPIPTLPPGQTPTLIAALEQGVTPAAQSAATEEATAETGGEESATAAATEESGDTGAQEPDPALGEQLFTQNCTGCHGETAGPGPAMPGISERAGSRVEGETAQEYIHQSIVDPGAYVVEGFQNIMPKNYADQFSDHELDSLVAYLMTQ